MLIVAALALPVNGAETLQWSGFGFLRGADSPDSVPFTDDRLAAQLQIGLDWTPSLLVSGHVHLLARDDPERSRRGSVGVVQAYLDLSVPRGEDRFRVLAGAFFLPTTRENVDALWETPYTIIPSALNSWLGEEFRPIGVDVSYDFRRALTLGATVYRGNDTFGSFPADRGWALRDHWALLGEHLFVFTETEFGEPEDYYTSVSAENDGRLGWAARTRWTANYGTLQLTHIDNNSDGLEYGQLLNWDTQFSILGGDFTRNDWTVAAEAGWGVTTVVFDGIRFPDDIAAAYVLLSRRLGRGRASIRQDWFRNEESDDEAFTAAFFWSPRGPWRAGIELATSGDEQRALIELRYHFTYR